MTKAFEKKKKKCINQCGEEMVFIKLERNKKRKI